VILALIKIKLILEPLLFLCHAKKNAKSNPIFCNRLVNMVSNHIMKEEKTLFAYQIHRAMKKDSTKHSHSVII
jgi:hypothetical protein